LTPAYLDRAEEKSNPSDIRARDSSVWQVTGSGTELVHRSDIGSDLTGGSGSGSLEIRYSEWNGAASGAVQRVDVTGGTGYSISASYLVPGANNPAEATALFLSWRSSDNEQLRYDRIDGSFNIRDAWQEISKIAVAPEEAASLGIMLLVYYPNQPSDSPGVVIFDDILLIGGALWSRFSSFLWGPQPQEPKVPFGRPTRRSRNQRAW
jgi:hypothetical protein